MKEIIIQSKITVFHNLDELSDSDKTLVQEAIKATEKSYAPYSKFYVGCAILLENDEIISGGNQENASYPVCLCAEGVTLSAASAMYPKAAIQKMAIAVKSATAVGEPVAPCGVCRQRILEYEDRFKAPIEILLYGADESIFKVHSVRDILPLAFNSKNLI